MQTFAGLIDVAFGVFHLAFWRVFGWPERLLPSGRLNTAITQTINAVLTYVFVVYGGALVVWSYGGTRAHWFVLAAGAGFWALRFVLHFVWFDMRHKTSVLMTFLFFVAALAHGLAAAR